MDPYRRFRNCHGYGTLNLVTVRQESVEERFGGMMRAARSAAGLSQRSLAAAMNDRGFSAWVQSTVTKTEAGERPLRLNEALALCSILELDPQTLVAQLAVTESAEGRALREHREGLRIVQDRIGEIESNLAGLREVEGTLISQIALLTGEREPTLEEFYSQPPDDGDDA